MLLLTRDGELAVSSAAPEALELVVLSLHRPGDWLERCLIA